MRLVIARPSNRIDRSVLGNTPIQVAQMQYSAGSMRLLKRWHSNYRSDRKGSS
jgi:hypothetical protein